MDNREDTKSSTHTDVETNIIAIANTAPAPAPDASNNAYSDTETNACMHECEYCSWCWSREAMHRSEKRDLEYHTSLVPFPSLFWLHSIWSTLAVPLPSSPSHHALRSYHSRFELHAAIQTRVSLTKFALSSWPVKTIWHWEWMEEMGSDQKEFHFASLETKAIISEHKKTTYSKRGERMQPTNVEAASFGWMNTELTVEWSLTSQRSHWVYRSKWEPTQLDTWVQWKSNSPVQFSMDPCKEVVVFRFNHCKDAHCIWIPFEWLEGNQSEVAAEKKTNMFCWDLEATTEKHSWIFVVIQIPKKNSKREISSEKEKEFILNDSLHPYKHSNVWNLRPLEPFSQFHRFCGSEMNPTWVIAQSSKSEESECHNNKRRMGGSRTFWPTHSPPGHSFSFFLHSLHNGMIK